MKISWTQLESLRSCGLQYRLRYREHIRMPKDESVFLVGRVIHETVKDWVKAGWPQNFVDASVRDHLRREKPTLIRMQPDQQRVYVERAIKGANAAERLYRLKHFPEHDVIVEQWFDLQLPVPAQVHRIVGAADVYDPETRTLYDLKNYTGGNSGNPRQLKTYAFVMSLMDHPVEHIGFIYPFRSDKSAVKTFDLTQEDIDKEAEAIFGDVHAIEAGRFGPPTEGDHCYWCEFRRTVHCPVTRTQHVRDFSGVNSPTADTGA